MPLYPHNEQPIYGNINQQKISLSQENVATHLSKYNTATPLKNK